MPTFLLRRLGRLLLLALPAMVLFSSCLSSKYYKQRTLFRLTDSKGNLLDSTKLRIAVNRTERNYLIQPNDILTVQVNTNKGERILDPNGELQFGGTSSTVMTGGSGGASGGTGASSFLVQADGSVVLPLVNRVRVQGLSLLQADSVLAVRYNKYYKEPFVSTRVTNNRVIILGAPGGRVIPLANDNMNLLEVLALAGGLDGGGSDLYRYGGRANDIRIIRGDLKNPRVQRIDLTTIEGMRRANLQIEPNDIIYVDPVRRPIIEGFTEAQPFISFSSFIITTTLLVISIVNR
ncbi:polysaccharide biosynthesis/export family protein [Hymenobacter rubidus]|uniref:polysaccharide biosynthesis/export family protein n=1 Tax=Hymenobacter rubidus TaxID=1441626 RepID=UPI00191E4084|nr:polysaccharide biosynthesis/export family protein [Hymenobacter rubidus]